MRMVAKSDVVVENYKPLVKFRLGVDYESSIRHPALGTIEVQNQPVKLSRTPASMARATPEFGEHTDEVLKEFGCSDAEIRALRGAKVI